MAQNDIHFCLVEELALASGYSPIEAEIIAHASQLVDDAELHKPIKIYGLPNSFAGLLNKDDLFDPICTAYNGIEMFYLLGKGPQMKSLIPFHFVPPEFYRGRGEYNWVTEYKSLFVMEIVDRAIAAVRDAKNHDERVYGLIKLGVALHTFVDSATHQGFSGRLSSDDNSVKVLRKINHRKRKMPLNELIPPVGHAQAGDYPDLPYLKFEYENGLKGKVFRDNRDLVDAVVVDAFRILNKANNSYRFLSAPLLRKIESCLSFQNKRLSRRMGRWWDEFPKVKFSYDKNTWQREAIGNELPFDVLESLKFVGTPRYEFRGDRKWFWFHQAAKEQREFVMSRIKKNLK